MSSTLAMEGLKVAAKTNFALPPVVHTPMGETRRCGIEFEYSGLSLEESGRLVQQVFGGEHDTRETYIQHVNTNLGSFQIEIDLQALKHKKYEPLLTKIGVDLKKHKLRWLEKTLLKLAQRIAPTEISTPPIPITHLAALDDLRNTLRLAGALGTRASLLYAFGLHLNVEIPTDDPLVLRDFLRAFILLEPWIKKAHEVYFVRKIASFAKPFPEEYAQLILKPDYEPTIAQFLDDYIQHNPTRDKAIDMLPILVHLDPDLCDRIKDPEMVRPRPAFHYRLPNCQIDEPSWSIAREWNIWVEIERLAYDAPRLEELSRQYLSCARRSGWFAGDPWPKVLESYLRV